MEKRLRASRLSVEAWHQRFEQQAAWTRSLREYLFNTCNLSTARRVVEIGCGTGAITSHLANFTQAQVLGIDLRLDFLQFASRNQTCPHPINADGMALPLQTAGVDAAICHYLLLWVSSPHTILAEMRRVTRPGGVVLALAEPDYGGRVDFPTELTRLGWLQTQSLKEQGANPFIGRELSHWFHLAGLTQVQIGVMGGEWHQPPTLSDFESEWQIVQDDLVGIMPPEELSSLYQFAQKASLQGTRTLFVPTFFAAGIVPPA